ncbi:MAG: bifunctional diaminohydroxyphosphoribosylaminopyrimidine deaminase/5-amino-6-(5-phosphoribosylamino)uracil reductase RibD [Bacteroidota bacterium]
MMSKCLSLATRGLGYVSPNPLVGAVLVRNGRVLARGYHRRFGGPHAEVECIRSHRGSFADTTLYVNLEPCVHVGKTPPCTRFIISKRIPRVVVAMRDPNSLVAGRGISALRRAGIKVTVGILENEATELNREFVTHIVRRWPYIHMKVAQTLDGKIAPHKGKRVWISSSASRTLVHHWRATHDAVLVGVGTIIADDPILDARLVRGRNPHAVILDGNFSIPISARVFKIAGRNVFVCVKGNVLKKQKAKAARLERRGVVFIPIANQKQSLKPVLKKVYRYKIGSLLVEGGGKVFASFIRQSLVDRLSVFLSPNMMGDGTPGISLHQLSQFAPADLRVESIGKDILIAMNLGGT